MTTTVKTVFPDARVTQLSDAIRKNEQNVQFAKDRRRREGKARTAKRRGEARRLGNHANKVSAQGSAKAKWLQARNESLLDRRLLHELFKGWVEDGKIVGRERIANCGKVPVSSSNDFTGKVGKDSGVAHLSGYQTCGSIWACSVCAPRIRQFRADEISQGVRNWLGQGKQAYFVTLTVPHHKGQPLEETWEVLSSAWKEMLQGRARYRFFEEVGIVGTIRASDLTHGQNGWHPHLHNLIIVDDDSDTDHTETINEYFANRWPKAVERLGLGQVNIAKGIRVDLVKNEAGIGQYVSKISYELTRTDKKTGRRGGRNYFEILRDARNGEADNSDISLVREFYKVSKGKRCIEWSRDLRTLLLGDESTLSDEEIVAQETEDPPLIVFDHGLGRLLGRNIFLRIACLEGLETNGADGMRAALIKAKIKVSTEWYVPPWLDEDYRGPPIPRLELAA